MRPAPLIWRCREAELVCGSPAQMMGVLNVTPDSFSDDVHFFDHTAAIARGVEMTEQGAAIIDVGGESTRPGAEPVPLDEEIRRVIPVIEALAETTQCLLSVDTTKAAVADAALQAGAHIVNDITALGDPEMAEVIKHHGAGVVLMHMQGTPQTMQKNPMYSDVVGEIREFFYERINVALDAGIDRHCIAIDPGIGFGKTVMHNVRLVSELDAFKEVRCPIMMGLSHKSFLGALTGRTVYDRLLPSLGALAFAITRGAHILRVHDVKESCEMARLIAILQYGQVVTE
ncbi:MAG: dihydropteroate synthase [Kiritimatiellae bacterium]|nr:dihydropteroate synthase [Kiritimatiellia bacterium]